MAERLIATVLKTVGPQGLVGSNPTASAIKRLNMICLNCGKEIIDKKRKNRKYCCNQCQQDYQWKQTKKLIESEKTFQLNNYNEYTARRTAKKYLIEKYGHKCDICGTTHWLGKPILLIADHIDGDATNNSINNIRLICSNCDATLDTYKAKNKSTRTNRK